MLFAQKQGLAHPYFLYEKESLQRCLSYDLIQMATLSFLEVQFFQRIGFLGGPIFIRSRVRVCKVILVHQSNWGKNYLLGVFVTARIF